MPTHKQPHIGNLQEVATTIRSLNLRLDQITELKRTPFWLLIEIILNETFSYNHWCRHDTSRTKILSYLKQNKPSLEFVFRIYIEKLKETDVRLLFGIRDGERTIDLGLKYFDSQSEFLLRCFPEKKVKTGYHLNTNIIHQKLVEASQKHTKTDAQDVARLVTAYIVGALLIQTRNLTIPWALTTILGDFDAVCDHNWSGLAVDTLISRLKDKDSSSLIQIGCVFMLPYWLCERTTLVEPIQALTFPRFMKWDLGLFRRVLMQTNLKNDCVVNEPLKASEQEKALLRNKKYQPPIEKLQCLRIEEVQQQRTGSVQTFLSKEKRALEILPNVPTKRVCIGHANTSAESSQQAHIVIEVDDDIPEWTQVLEPVRKLNINQRDEILRCVDASLKKNPPNWAEQILKYLMRGVYKNNDPAIIKKTIFSLLVCEKCDEEKDRKKEMDKINTNLFPEHELSVSENEELRSSAHGSSMDQSDALVKIMELGFVSKGTLHLAQTELNIAKSRVKELEQELKESEVKRADSESRFLRAIKFVKESKDKLSEFEKLRIQADELAKELVLVKTQKQEAEEKLKHCEAATKIADERSSKAWKALNVIQGGLADFNYETSNKCGKIKEEVAQAMKNLG